MKPPLRKPNLRYGGIQVRICGRALGEGGLICQLPPGHPPSVHHSAIGYTDEGAVIAAIRLQHSEETVTWQLVGPHE